MFCEILVLTSCAIFLGTICLPACCPNLRNDYPTIFGYTSGPVVYFPVYSGDAVSYSSPSCNQKKCTKKGNNSPENNKDNKNATAIDDNGDTKGYNDQIDRNSKSKRSSSLKTKDKLSLNNNENNIAKRMTVDDENKINELIEDNGDIKGYSIQIERNSKSKRFSSLKSKLSLKNNSIKVSKDMTDDDYNDENKRNERIEAMNEQTEEMNEQTEEMDEQTEENNEADDEEQPK